MFKGKEVEEARTEEIVKELLSSSAVVVSKTGLTLGTVGTYSGTERSKRRQCAVSISLVMAFRSNCNCTRAWHHRVSSWPGSRLISRSSAVQKGAQRRHDDVLDLHKRLLTRQFTFEPMLLRYIVSPWRELLIYVTIYKRQGVLG